MFYDGESYPQILTCICRTPCRGREYELRLLNFVCLPRTNAHTQSHKLRENLSLSSFTYNQHSCYFIYSTHLHANSSYLYECLQDVQLKIYHKNANNQRKK